MKSSLMKAAAVLAVSVGAMGLASAPAIAAGQATNNANQYLTAYPSFGLPQSCHSRSIYLAAGNYTWKLENVGPIQDGTSSRTIYLAAGTYKWNDCLTPEDGYYNQYSQLSPPSGGAATIAIDESPSLFGSGYFTWGSTLTPQF